MGVVEHVLNILCLFIAVVVISDLAKHYAIRSDQGRPWAAHIRKGTKLQLFGVPWAEKHATLVMALSVDCHYCRESAGFYRQILKSNSASAFYPIAIFPTSIAVAGAYLRSESIDVSDVREADFGKLGIDGTPTLMLVDESGRIRSIWVGKLSPEEEGDVAKALGIDIVADLNSSSQQASAHKGSSVDDTSDQITAAQLSQLLQKGAVMPLVDVRERAEYEKRHILGSYNIPNDELEVRAPHELPKWATIVLYCDSPQACERDARAQGIPTMCSVAATMMREFGFVAVKVLSDDPTHFKEAGLTYVSDDRAGSEMQPVASGR